MKWIQQLTVLSQSADQVNKVPVDLSVDKKKLMVIDKVTIFFEEIKFVFLVNH